MSALTPLIASLGDAPRGCAGRWIARTLEDGVRLNFCREPVDSDVWNRFVLAQANVAGVSVSRSSAGAYRATVAAQGARVGVDVETLGRVALNTGADDAWLTPHERLIVENAADRALEIACHWVLKEAYGKALGVGLALPLDMLTFGICDGAIALSGSTHGWRFGLYRHADAVIAVAVQTATPFAPAGRNPPMPLFDR